MGKHSLEDMNYIWQMWHGLRLEKKTDVGVASVKMFQKHRKVWAVLSSLIELMVC